MPLVTGVGRSRSAPLSLQRALLQGDGSVWIKYRYLAYTSTNAYPSLLGGSTACAPCIRSRTGTPINLPCFGQYEAHCRVRVQRPDILPLEATGWWLCGQGCSPDLT